MLRDPRDEGWPLDLDTYHATVRRARRLRPYFRPRFEGFEVFRRPVGLMVVANHGLFALEAGCLVDGVWQAARRPIRGLGDHVLYKTRLQRILLARSGGLEGTPENAHRALTAGHAVYVNPGGAREALAAAKDRYRLFWDGHVGYVRAAIRASCPIVPLAVVGSDELYRQVLGRDEVGKAAFGRFVADVFGEKYVTPLYLGVGPLPLPMQLRFHAGAAIEVPSDPAAADDPAVVSALHAQAQAAVEALLEEGLAQRRQELAAMPPSLERTLVTLVHRAADAV